MMRRLTTVIIVPLAASAAFVLGGCSADAESTGATSPAAGESSTRDTPADGSSPSSVPAPLVGAGSAYASAAPTCDTEATLIEMTEGPYYTEGAPRRSTVSDADTAGTPLVLTGTVYDADCQPVAGATIDVWQADGNGDYDNSGYDLRGVLTTDADGRYTLTTVVPGIYTGRTEHIHVKVSAPGGPVYTTQLYVPGPTENEGDNIFDEALLITVTEDGQDEMLPTFDFVLP